MLLKISSASAGQIWFFSDWYNGPWILSYAAAWAFSFVLCLSWKEAQRASKLVLYSLGRHITCAGSYIAFRPVMSLTHAFKIGRSDTHDCCIEQIRHNIHVCTFTVPKTSIAWLQIWLQDGQKSSQLASFHGHSDSVMCLSWSEDGTKLASGMSCISCCKCVQLNICQTSDLLDLEDWIGFLSRKQFWHEPGRSSLATKNLNAWGFILSDRANRLHTAD